MNEQIDELEKYKDYTYIMYILCDKTSSFYSKIKNTINIPIVLSSTGLSMMNTYTAYDIDFSKKIQHISVVLNIFIALSLSILNIFKITEKEFFFNSQSIKFLKMYNKINLELSKKKTIFANSDITNIITEYNILCEHIQFHFPSHIRNKVIKTYRRYKLPFLASGNKKDNFLTTYFDEQKTDTDDLTPQSNESVKSLSTSNSYTYYVSDSAPNTPQLQYKKNQFVATMSPIESVAPSSPLTPAYISSDEENNICDSFDEKLYSNRRKYKRNFKKNRNYLKR